MASIVTVSGKTHDVGPLLGDSSSQALVRTVLESTIELTDVCGYSSFQQLWKLNRFWAEDQRAFDEASSSCSTRSLPGKRVEKVLAYPGTTLFDIQG